MDRKGELRVGTPDGFRLVGYRKQDDIVMIAQEDRVGPGVRQIGFSREYTCDVKPEED